MAEGPFACALDCHGRDGPRCYSRRLSYEALDHVHGAIFFATLRRKASLPLVASSDRPTGTPLDSARGNDTCGNRLIPAIEVSESARG